MTISKSPSDENDNTSSGGGGGGGGGGIQASVEHVALDGDSLSPLGRPSALPRGSGRAAPRVSAMFLPRTEEEIEMAQSQKRAKKMISQAKSVNLGKRSVYYILFFLCYFLPR